MRSSRPEAQSPEAAPSPALAPPPGSPRFALFDSLRGVAVLFIVAYHVAAVSGFINTATLGRAVIALGNEALILFFVISGFLLYRPFVAARAGGRPLPNVRRYARRRVLRIVPAYWAALTVLAVFPGIAGVFSEDWWRYYGFLQLYSEHTLLTGIPPAWSLCVEVTFYLLLPFWAIALRRARLGTGPHAWLRAELAALAFVALAGVVVQVAAARRLISDLVAQSLPGQSTWLALGMALAVVSVAADRGRAEPGLVRAVARRPGLCWLGAAAALAGLTALVHPGGLFGLILALRTEQPVARTLGGIALTAAMATLVVLPAVFGERAGGWPRRLLATRSLTYLGVISYSVYLYHLPIAHLLGLSSDPVHFSASGLGLVEKIDHGTTLVLFLLTLAVSVVVASLSYRLVELPFLRRKEGS